MTEIAALLLAAGSASRYRAAGGPEPSKLVASYRGEPLARAAARAALGAGLAVTVVTGHAREAVEAALQGLPLSFVYNPDFATGLASSLKAGVRALRPETDGALVLLGDMPEVTPALLTRLVAAFAARSDALAVIPVHAGRRGNPVLLARALFGDIEALTGDEGARRLIQAADPGRVVELDVADAAVTLDIDTPADLAATSGETPQTRA
jgi:molybdenum cofactor cytidylyltransferase